MSQSSKSAEVLQYDTSLVLAIELSSKTWVLAAQVPDLPKTKANAQSRRTSWLFSPRSRATGPDTRLY
jgi:hypothetical protein